MAQQVETFVKCPQCHGTGTFEPASGSQGSGSLSCNWPGCGATGFVSMEKFTLNPGLSDVMDKLGDIEEKVNEIKEIVDGL